MKKLDRWLHGRFICRKCGKAYCINGFGFGEAICPDCYEGEDKFLFYDVSFFLNRWLVKICQR